MISFAGAPAIPCDLNGWAETRLFKVPVVALREQCQVRGIDIGDRAQTRTCVAKLLKWKEPPSSRGGDRTVSSTGGLVTEPVNLRSSSLPAAARIWEYNDDEDKYQNKKRTRIRGDIERDHVIEVQLLEHAFNTMPCANRTRNAQTEIYSVINDVVNLNNTTHDINQKKKGPFTAALNDMKAQGGNFHTCRRSGFINTYVTEKHMALRDSGNWSRIKEQIVQRHDEVHARVEDSRPQTVFMENLNEMLQSMGIHD